MAREPLPVEMEQVLLDLHKSRFSIGSVRVRSRNGVEEIVVRVAVGRNKLTAPVQVDLTFNLTRVLSRYNPYVHDLEAEPTAPYDVLIDGYVVDSITPAIELFAGEVLHAAWKLLVAQETAPMRAGHEKIAKHYHGMVMTWLINQEHSSMISETPTSQVEILTQDPSGGQVTAIITLAPGWIPQYLVRGNIINQMVVTVTRDAGDVAFTVEFGESFPKNDELRANVAYALVYHAYVVGLEADE